MRRREGTKGERKRECQLGVMDLSYQSSPSYLFLHRPYPINHKSIIGIRFPRIVDGLQRIAGALVKEKNTVR